MRYLTDHAEATAGLLPRGASWRKAELAQLPDEDRLLCAVFGITAAVWICDVPVPVGAPRPDRRMILIDRAGASQFDAAMEALKQGRPLPDGLVCVALEGARFRGQRNRPWSAVRGNLHLTAHYRIDEPAIRVETGLTMLPAVASAQAIIAASEQRACPRIKWVNDILLDGKKVSGVLTATHVQGATVERAVFGLGVNVARAPDIEPTPFVPAAGSLADFSLSLRRVFDAVVHELDHGVERLCAGGSPALFPVYHALADFIGREVCIWPEQSEDWRQAKPLLRGQVHALRPDLSLEISGEQEPVRSGRMSYV